MAVIIGVKNMRKYQTEFGLNVYTNYKTIIPPSHLELIDNDERKYHIYGILLTPKFFCAPESITYYADHFEIRLFSNSFGENQEYTVPIQIHKTLDHKKIKIQSSYPCSVLKINIEDDAWLSSNKFEKEFEINVGELFDLVANSFVEKLKYKVLYIGQAYGKRGERSATERLSSHETLQKILIDSQRNYPEYEIKIMLLDMGFRLGIGIANKETPVHESNDTDNKHIESIFKNLPIEQQVINITEAAMINYFKPSYNTTFVENFPSDKHKSYRQYYELDYNELVVEIDMEFDNFPFVELFSDTARIKSVWDFIHYKLDNNAGRESMYSIFCNVEQ